MTLTSYCFLPGILEAAEALGADEEQIKEIVKEIEEGAEDEEDNGEHQDGSMEGVEKTVPRPHQIIYKIYQEATPHLAQLQKNPTSKTAAKELNSVNDRIKEQNKKEELEPSDQWIIRYQEFAEVYQKARPAIKRIRKDPNNETAKRELEGYSDTLKDIINRNHYLDWNIKLDIAAPENPQTRGRKETKSPETAKAPKPPGAPKTAPKPPEDKNQSKPTESNTGKGPQVSAPARSQAAQKIQSETLKLWANMDWATHKIGDDDIILSHKPLFREGKDPYAFEFTVMAQDSPYFQIKLSSEIDRQEMDAYLALPKIYEIKTDLGDPDTPVYTYRNKANYSKLL